MTLRQKRAARVAILLLVLVAVAVWRGQVYFSRWQGTVTQVVMPPSPDGTGAVMVRDEKGRVFRVNLPADQVALLKVGDRLVKERMSLGVRLVDTIGSASASPAEPSARPDPAP
jgi:hypothetical protein